MNDLIKAATFNYPDEIPVHVDILPATWMKYREKLRDLLRDYKDVYGIVLDTQNFDFRSPRYAKGEHTDEWGCTWTNIREGMDSMCTGHPIKTKADMLSIQIPKKTHCLGHGFFFQRLVYLRGFENLMIDFAEGSRELGYMIDRVFQYVERQTLGGYFKHPNGIAYFGDDLGIQTGLPMSPDMWRKWLKPYYKEIFRLVKNPGDLVFLHSDGDIHEIIPDLIECGVDILNIQGGKYEMFYKIIDTPKRICIDYGLDRQIMYRDDYDPSGELQTAIWWLAHKDGGLWIRAEISPDVPLENIERILHALRWAKGFFKE